MGKLSRSKGKVFERWVASQFREAYPYLESVRRSQQGAGAEQSDVTGVPGLWIECRDGVADLGRTKLKQAEGDVYQAQTSALPIAVCHRSRSPMDTTEVVLRLCDLIVILGCDVEPDDIGAVVTIRLVEFLEVAAGYVRQMWWDNERDSTNDCGRE